MTFQVDEVGHQQLADHLFISYASEDSEFAEWLTLRLTTEGYKVWCDRVKLLGGESYPRHIDKALKTQTFRMLAILSKHSLSKGHPLKERTLAHNIGLQRKIDFIIPILVDDTRPDELDWMDSDLTYIPFNKSWAEGLLQLTKKLQSIYAPRPLENGPKLVSDWIAQQAYLSDERERLWSNLFEIKSIPSVLYKIKIHAGFTPPERPWIFYRQSAEIYWSFEVPDPDMTYVVIEWNDDRRSTHGIAPIDVATILIKEHIRAICLQKRARETLDGELYLSYDAFPDGWMRFVDSRGKKSRLLATGERTFKSIEGTRKAYCYHLSPLFRPVLKRYGTPVLELRVRLYLTDNQGVTLEPGIANRRRKRIAKNWWNHEWMSRVLAVGQWVLGGKSVCNLSAEYGYEISVSGKPVVMTAPLSIDERSLEPPKVDKEIRQVIADEDDAADTDWSDG
jgi:hypothetical protein